MRRTDELKVQDLCESIKGIGLLHAISVAENGENYLLLSGLHRVESFKVLGKDEIPALVHKSNHLTNSLIEVEENLCRSDLNAIQTAEHIVRREELLVALGRKAIVGNNQYTEEKITNEELARSMGMTRRTYQYKKCVANLNPEAKEILCETSFADNLMDMVKLQKEPDHIQIEIANLLASGKARSFRRAWVVAHMRFGEDRWGDEIKKTRQAVGIPKSIMRFDKIENELSRICYLVNGDEELRKAKASVQFGTNQISNYTMNPEHSRWFLEFYSKPGDLILDNFCGRGTNIITAAFLGRRVVGYDLSSANLAAIQSAVLEYTCIDASDLRLHHSCGVELSEYSNELNKFDLILNDPPFYGAEQYENGDERDLCLLKNIDEYHQRMEVCLRNMKRLVKTSNFREKVFHPIVMKLGSIRRGESGLVDLASEVESIARSVGLVIHDKIHTELKSAFQSHNLGRCIRNKYSVKSHETNLVLVKYS